MVPEQAPSIDVSSLSYLFPDGSSGLTNVNISLPPGSRTLLIGGTSSQPPFSIIRLSPTDTSTESSKRRWKDHLAVGLNRVFWASFVNFFEWRALERPIHAHP